MLFRSAYLRMHESEKTGKDSGKTRLEYSQIFVDFEKNKKKRSFKRKMVLGITPNTKFVYSLTGESETPVFYVFIKLFMKLEKYKGQKSALKRTKKLAKGKGLYDMMFST